MNEGPLAGRRIVVTRGTAQSSPLAEALRAQGAIVIEVPAIEIGPPGDLAPLDDALGSLERYRWVVFTSANAVGAVRERLVALGLPIAIGPRGPRLASVGPSTSEACLAAFPADAISLQPESDFRTAGLLRAFAGGGGTTVAGVRVLLPASSRARNELPRGLRELGAVVDVVEAYRITEPSDLAEKVGRCFDLGFDAATFASPSAVDGFVAAAGGRARGRLAVAIGPTTEAAARAGGLDVRAVAEPSTAEGLVAALVGLFGRGEGAKTAGP